jgi:hypothetical protein
MPDARLTPEQLARFRADYHECAATVMPLALECELLTAERDRLAAACREAVARLEGLPDGARGFGLAAVARLLAEALATGEGVGDG